MNRLSVCILFALSYFTINAQTYLFVDSLYQYQVKIPKWLTINEDVDLNVFGGTFKSTDNTINSIYIYGFPKSNFKSFNEFKFKFIDGNVAGKESLFDLKYIARGKGLSKKIENGYRCKMMFEKNNITYHYEFVLLNTEDNYLWIYFEATPETYNENIDKFEQWIKGIKLINP